MDIMVFVAAIFMCIMWLGVLFAAFYYCLYVDLRLGWFAFAIFIEFFFAKAIYATFLAAFA